MPFCFNILKFNSIIYVEKLQDSDLEAKPYRISDNSLYTIQLHTQRSKSIAKKKIKNFDTHQHLSPWPMA